jgi:2-polyprenyl-3-methyl-5-hydroxy-6-metoxy-1,4-benzoquinol methylase
MKLHCPICETSTSIKEYGKNDILTLYECKECKFAFQDRNTYVSPYENIDYYDPTKQPEEPYPLVPNKTDADRVNTLRKVLKSGKILEIGGGLGKTSILAASLGYDVTIIEESNLAIAQGLKFHTNLKWVHSSVIPDSYKVKTFDAVMMFHVLEHIPDLKAFLEETSATLKDDSYFIVEVPNWMSLTRKVKKMNWIYVLDHHPNQFSKTALIKLFGLYKFQPLSVEYRRTFAINEMYPVKENLKKVLCALGLGNVIRITFKKC